MPDLGAHDVAGVGDAYEDAVEPGVDDAVGEGARGVRGVEQLAIAIGCGKRDLAGGVDDDVAASELFVAVSTVGDLGVVGNEAERVAQVLDFGGHLCLVDVAQVELVCDSLHQQTVGNVRAHMALAHHADLSSLVHIRVLSAEVRVRVIVVRAWRCAEIK